MLSSYQRFAINLYQKTFSFLPPLAVDWCLKSNRFVVTKFTKFSLRAHILSYFLVLMNVIYYSRTLMILIASKNTIPIMSKVGTIIMCVCTLQWIPIIYAFYLLSRDTSWILGFNQLLETLDRIQKNYGI